MIRLRRMLERGRAHPLLGPVLLVVLVLLLAMVFVHAAHDGMDAATQFGAMCFALASFFGLTVLDRLRRRPHEAGTWASRERGPPTISAVGHRVSAQIAVSAPSSIPLRR